MDLSCELTALTREALGRFLGWHEGSVGHQDEQRYLPSVGCGREVAAAGRVFGISGGALFE